jgi:AraC-like DNA-binding protein
MSMTNPATCLTFSAIIFSVPATTLPSLAPEGWPTLRTPASVRLLIELGGEHGLPPGPCLTGTGLRLSDLGRPDAEVEAEQELAVIRNLVDALPDVPGLGLQAGARYHLTTHGIWGFALISSPDLRSAIDFGLRYLDLTFAFCRISLEQHGQEAVMILDDSAIPEDLRRFLVEREGASILTLQRELFSAAIPLLRVEVTYPEPTYAELYEPVFGVRPRFGAGGNLATFDAALLDLPLPQANELTARACEDQCRALLEQRTARAGIARRVREQLIRANGRIPGLADVARALGTSERSLRRQLAREGTAFRSLVTELRMTLAEEFLSSRAMTIEEIASRLGYSEAASFTRAFVRQYGMPPGEYRRGRPDRTTHGEAIVCENNTAGDGSPASFG